MKPDDDTYRSFLDDLADAVRRVAKEHGLDEDVVVEAGRLSVIAVRGRLEGDRPVELVAHLASDIGKARPGERRRGLVNRRAKMPEIASIDFAVGAARGNLAGSLADGGRRRRAPAVELEGAIGPLRGQDELKAGLEKLERQLELTDGPRSSR